MTSSKLPDAKILGQRLAKVSRKLPTPDVTRFMTELCEVHRQNQRTQLEIAQIQNKRAIIESEMRERYKLYREVFGEIFMERRAAIQKSFDVIDEGLRSKDNELVNSGMRALSEVVSASPFSDAATLAQVLESGGKIEL